MKKFKKLGFAMACAAMLAASSCSDGSDDGNIVLPLQQPSTPTAPEKTSCEYLFILYCDGDNNLFPDITRDMNNLALGLNSTNTQNQIKVLCLFDGPNFSTEETAELKSMIKNQKYLDTVGETRLIELKAVPKETFSVAWGSMESDYTFDVITGKTFTETCGFIPKNSEGKYEADMSDYNTLRNLLNFAEKTYSPKYTFLSINDHGTGAASATGAIRAVCTDETNGKGIIGNDEIRIAIENSKLRKVDILLLDCCLEANIENAYELKDCVTYFVGSPNVSYGVPWYPILADFMKQDTTPLKLAEQIVIEASYEMANDLPVTTDNVGSKMPYLNTNSEYSPTYTALDLSNSKAANIEKSFRKVIDIIYNSLEDGTGFLADKETAWNNSLQIYCKNNPDYVPKPADYLVSSDYSFLISRNVHGWVGDAPENYGSSTNIPIFTPNIRGMTCMAYNGSLNQLVDIGYLMDMFICNTYYSTTYADAELCPGVKGSDFVAACKQVCEDIYQSLIISHRVDCSIKRAEADNIINIYDDIDDTNFYVQKIMENPVIKSVFEGRNHYGLAVSSCNRPEDIGDPAALYINIGGSPSLYKNIGSSSSENGSMVYKDCCKFVKETKWLPLLKKILPENNVVWGQFDKISSPEIYL